MASLILACASPREVVRDEEEMNKDLEKKLSHKLPRPGEDEDHNKVKRKDRPLTRYLPIPSSPSSFDLLHHIESVACHDVASCSRHVTVTSHMCRGFLLKMSQSTSSSSSYNLRGSWNRRWFTFDRSSRRLTYHLSPSDHERGRAARGAVLFREIEDVRVDHGGEVRSPEPERTFCVATRSRTFYLVAPSVESMRLWVDVVFTGAEGYEKLWADG